MKVLFCLTFFLSTVFAQDIVVDYPLLRSTKREVKVWEPVEITYMTNLDFGDLSNFYHVDFRVDITNPNGSQFSNSGFYYNKVLSSDEPINLWKARVTCKTAGVHHYQAVLTLPDSSIRTRSGSYRCINSQKCGSLKINLLNPNTLIDQCGKLTPLIGVNNEINVDGGGRTQSGPGAFVGTYNLVESVEDSIIILRDAGVNAIRLRNKGKPTQFCGPDPSYPNYDGVCNKYYHDTAMNMDRVMIRARKLGVHILFSIFGNMYQSLPLGNQMNQAQRKLIDYVYARYGTLISLAYQNHNEKKSPYVSYGWDASVNNYQRSIPFNQRIIGESCFQTESQYVLNCPANIIGLNDYNAPHYYETSGLLSTDLVVRNLASTWRQDGLTLITETGQKLAGMNNPGATNYSWQPSSSMRFLLQTWSSIFEQVWPFYFHRSGTSKNGGFFIGLKERGILQILNRFNQKISHPDLQRKSIGVSQSNILRAYGLEATGYSLGIFVHRKNSHQPPAVSGVSLDFNSSITGMGQWIDPETGQMIALSQVSMGSNTINVPPILKTMAFYVVNSERDVRPIALPTITNNQWNQSHDLDGDGVDEYGPGHPAHGRIPLTLQFNGGQSVSWNNRQLTYHWSFGDGSSTTGQTVSHTYTQKGVYFVRLRVGEIGSGKKAYARFVVRTNADIDPSQDNSPQFSQASIGQNFIIRVGEGITGTPQAVDSEITNGQYSLNLLNYNMNSSTPSSFFGQFEHYSANTIYTPYEFKFVPLPHEVGSHSFTFQATDAAGNQATPMTINVTVLPP